MRTSRDTWIRVLNLRGAVVYDGPPGTLPRLPVGHYFVETAKDKTQFAVLPSDYTGVSFLGTEANWDGSVAQLLQQIGPGWSRALYNGNTWHEVEPQRGVWDWQKLDTVVAGCQQSNSKLILTAWLRPTWLTEDTEFIPLYCQYLRQLCLRYGDQLYAIEIWNEPNSRARWPDSPAEWLPFEKSAAEVPAAYLNVLSNAYLTIKGIDPHVKVYGAGWGTPITEGFIEQLAALGGRRYLDGFTFHDYSMRDAPPDQSALLPDGLRPRIDQVVAKYRSLYSGRNLVMNEGGLYGRSALGIPNTQENGRSALLSNLDWRRGMNRTIKFTVMYRAAGVQAVIAHVLTNWANDPGRNNEVLGWEYGNRGPHPKTTAFLMTGYRLNGARLTAKRIIDDKVFLYEWELANGRKLLFAWCTEGHTVTWRPDEVLRPTDIFGSKIQGHSLGEEPLLFSDITVETFAKAIGR
ncbi:MAG TPA: hypothetical protein VL171_06930 [Verrucomicrobiae bacterium]|nr:hypothetical protein [Verrucomicrobiae bacterium]